MDRQVGIKLENARQPYEWFYSSYRVEERLHELVGLLKEDKAIVVKTGNEHHYIDFDENAQGNYDYEIRRIMYYVKQYLRQ